MKKYKKKTFLDMKNFPTHNLTCVLIKNSGRTFFILIIMNGFIFKNIINYIRLNMIILSPTIMN